ncbi:Vacuolar protein sorting-associated protein 72 [Coemansia guatemalensis]|uniref:Vacuolar protein sorting-associated protein 72 n=1 Tax=Coemansia guatemalensis TaxID=2761395 RepID=A0A9W8LSS8_9FUNG|nr:Vacuolar protein sorting-associated protein 72 [Coemansia guatemalensis]
MRVPVKRSRRQNAGNKMTLMIEEERAKIESGETVLSEDDEEFTKKGDGEDIVDSDFEETDSEAEKAADAASKEIEDILEKAERKKQRKIARKQRIVPQFASTKRTSTDLHKSLKDDHHQSSTASKKGIQAPAQRKAKPVDIAVRFSSRASAVRKAQETEAREQEREVLAAAKRRRKKSNQPEIAPRLTQEQLLEEAKQTEAENLAKLKEFQELEAEERQLHRRLIGSRKEPLMIQPVAHWRSSIVSDTNANSANAADAIPEDVKETLPVRDKIEYALKDLDQTHFPFNPWATSAPAMRPKICAVTGLPARYFHPRAKVPYANSRAYRILEELVQGRHAYFYDIDIWSSTDIIR